MPKRRGRNEGGISKTKYGKYQAFFNVESDKLGDSRKRITKNFARKEDALSWLTKEKSERMAGRGSISSTTTLGEWYAQWKSIKSNTISRKSLQQITWAYERCIEPYFADKRIGKITVADVIKWYSQMEADGIPKNRQGRGGLWLRAIMEGAVDAGVIISNPVQKVPKPKTEKKEMICWNQSESRAFLESIAEVGQPYRALYRFLLDSGCRPSEALALRWNDYNSATGFIRVMRSLESHGKKSEVRIKETKTPKGRRSILLAPSTRRELDSLAREGEYIFMSAGEWLQQQLVMRRFARHIEKHKLKAIRFYDLRHTSATLLLQAGVNIKVISDRLGHADPAMTLRAYAHALPTMQESCAIAGEMLWGFDPSVIR